MRIYPLGKVAPGTTTPAAVNSNFPLITKTTKISIRALSNNAGKIYVGQANMNISTLSGVVEILGADERLVIQDEGTTSTDLFSLCVISDTNGTDGVLVTGYEK